MKITIEFKTESGAISCEPIDGPDYENDCYSNWKHPEYIKEIENSEKDILDSIEEYVINELGGNLTKDYPYVEDNLILLNTLVNDENRRASFSELKKWKQHKTELWLKDSYIEVYINGYLLSDLELMDLFKNNKSIILN